MPSPHLFRRARWARVATDDELAALEAEHAELDYDAQAAEGTRVDEIGDHDLRAELDARTAPEKQPSKPRGGRQDKQDGQPDSEEPKDPQ